MQILVPYRGSSYSLVMALQVGDGISAALFRDGSPSILGNPDSGRYAGETIFVTSTSSWSRADVYRRIYPFFSPMRALMVMTATAWPTTTSLSSPGSDVYTMTSSSTGSSSAGFSCLRRGYRRGPGGGSAGAGND